MRKRTAALSVSCENMNKLRIIILSSLLAGCSPFPVHYPCDTPKFTIGDSTKDISYFDTSGYFEKFCPAGVAERFTYHLNENTKVTVRVRGEWIDLKPIRDGVPIKLTGIGIRELDFEGYTQAVRVDALANNTLSLFFPNSESINIKFNLVECTCVTYDAI
jgi:hypothetical protein